MEFNIELCEAKPMSKEKSMSKVKRTSKVKGDVKPSLQSGALVQGTLFEENYLQRTHKTLTTNPEIALTELVANAWDAGASQVDITIPEECGYAIIVKDNGTGLTAEEFNERWRRLSYNRIAHQGKKVEFPEGTSGMRLAFGRNGIGRHGMLCFNDEYKVITEKGGVRLTIEINSTDQDPVNIKSCEPEHVDAGLHGLTLQTVLKEHRPDPARILEVLSARFVSDPGFSIYVNSNKVEPYDLTGRRDASDTISVTDSIKIKILFIDTTASLRKGIYQGIAFWQAGRLVGEPSWILGKESILDGRTTNAKKFIFIVQSEDLEDFVNGDWTGFRECEEMDLVYSKVKEYVMDALGKYNKEHIDDIKTSIKNSLSKQYGALTALGHYEVEETIEHIAQTKPTASKESIEIAVEAVANVAQARSGEALLKKLAALDAGEVDALNDLLSKWSVKDALVVLDEIDRRLSEIEAIRKLSSNKKVDELHTLHPLITKSRWVFGPEYDSLEYRSNCQLQTIAKKIFKIQNGDFINPKRRPDLFVVGDSTCSMTGLEEMVDGIARTKTILLIELKRGGFKLTSKERHQAEDYVDAITHCGISENPKISTFVVGEEIDDRVSHSTTVNGNPVQLITFSHIVDTASKRLFRLRDKIQDRYEEISGEQLAQRLIQDDLPAAQ